jgi:hypothetical protein
MSLCCPGQNVIVECEMSPTGSYVKHLAGHNWGGSGQFKRVGLWECTFEDYTWSLVTSSLPSAFYPL